MDLAGTAAATTTTTTATAKPPHWAGQEGLARPVMTESIPYPSAFRILPASFSTRKQRFFYAAFREIWLKGVMIFFLFLFTFAGIHTWLEAQRKGWDFRLMEAASTIC